MCPIDHATFRAGRQPQKGFSMSGAPIFDDGCCAAFSTSIFVRDRPARTTCRSVAGSRCGRSGVQGQGAQNSSDMLNEKRPLTPSRKFDVARFAVSIGDGVNLTSFLYPVVQKTTSRLPATSHHGNTTALSEDVHRSDANDLTSNIASKKHRGRSLASPASQEAISKSAAPPQHLVSLVLLPQSAWPEINLQAGGSAPAYWSAYIRKPLVNLTSMTRPSWSF
jgi:hypothetical protein